MGRERACPLLARPRSCAPASRCRTSCSAWRSFPPPGGKCMTDQFRIVSGGCAVNAAIAVARLGGRALRRARSATPTMRSAISSWPRWRARASTPAGVVRVPGATAPVSGILIDGAGERMIATYRDKRIEDARAADPDRLVANVALLLADNRFPGVRAADLRGGAAARHPGGARRRPADGRGRSAVCHPDPRDLFRRVPARDHRPDRSRRRPRSDGAAHRGVPGRQRRPECGALSVGGEIRAMPVFTSRPSIRSPPATCSMPASRWRWRKAATRLPPCASAPPRPRSNARASAAAWARRRAPRSRRSWRSRPTPGKHSFLLDGRARRAAGRAGAGEILGRDRPAARRRGQVIGEERRESRPERRWHRRGASVTRATGRTAAAA